MKVTNDLVKKLASLSKLDFERDELENIKKDLEKILTFVNVLDELNVDELPPLEHISLETNNIREDKVFDFKCKKSALENSPTRDSDYFKVNKVISNK